MEALLHSSIMDGSMEDMKRFSPRMPHLPCLHTHFRTPSHARFVGVSHAMACSSRAGTPGCWRLKSSARHHLR